MHKVQTGDPETHSKDLVADNIEQLRKLFPSIFTEGKVDFGALRELLGDAIEEGDEKFGLTWFGKRNARRIALKPSTATLLPRLEDSVGWDTTQNIMIEGDNLEVLKLLQKSYANKVKLIYIDPPYNTGKDFIYPDSFQESIQNYLELTGQTGRDGGRLSSNSETSGRYHSAWLDMMYPRLFLARQLMSEDGAIFISIDSTEVANLRLICDEIFGSDCFIIDLIWRKRDGAPNDRTVGSVHDHILVYGKALASNSTRTLAEERFNLMPRTAKADGEYKVFREPNGPDPRGAFRKIDTTANAKGGRDVASLHYGITNPYTGDVVYPREGTCWRHSQEEMERLQADGRLYWGVNGTGTTPMRKLYRSEAKDGMTTPSILPDMPFNQHAARELEVLFGRKSIFDTPKPVDLLRLLVRIGSNPGDIVMDFFAGSGSTGSAVLRSNSEGMGDRRFILVQLPEPTGLRDFPTIADITRARLRSSVEAAAGAQSEADTGFRSFSLGEGNVVRWDTSRQDFEQQAFEHIDNIREARTEQDVLFELLLSQGLDLASVVDSRMFGGVHVFATGGGLLFACLPPTGSINKDNSEEIAQGVIDWRDELLPEADVTVFFKDVAFADDVAKANLVAILEQHDAPFIVKSL
ncbi:site-specific DNA-methyltransferase [Kitasatospora sp. NPDC001527]|uniref:site-specific DNA-methyltransferase n=1 Tax=Kitasatospora sp. NPDC001527 TaxID=3154519 RepID=UPI0033176FB0